MERKHFIQTLMGGTAILGLSSLQGLAENEPSTETMPVLFVGHGSPMNAIEDNIYTKNWQNLSQQVEKPKAIICISAHWLTKGSYVTAVDKPATIS
jgi:4,5-DOPA dioxygenase extradiol